MALSIAANCDGQQSKSDAKNPTAKERLASATKRVADNQTYTLRYKFKKDETIRWSVEHVASTKTQMAGELEETSSRSTSIKSWRVNSVDSLGNMTFVHMIEDVDMWQKIGESKPVSYDSKKGDEVPEEYKGVAEKLGKPLAVISIAPNGEITDRKSSLKNARFGTGDITIALPKKPVSVGYKWNVPTELRASNESGQTKLLKAHIAYELIKVKTGHAYISFRTVVLTPEESQKVRSQIMQQMTKGYLVFDIAAGRPIRKEVEWDETVQGYEGPDSFLHYLGRMSEKLVEGNSKSKKQNGILSPLKPKTNPKVSERVKIKTRDGKPVLRK